VLLLLFVVVDTGGDVVDSDELLTDPNCVVPVASVVDDSVVVVELLVNAVVPAEVIVVSPFVVEVDVEPSAVVTLVLAGVVDVVSVVVVFSASITKS
jgi:hypothetical protein